jgi:hypothetical protein
VNPVIVVLALALVAVAAYAWRLRQQRPTPSPTTDQVAALRAQLAAYDEAAKLLAARIIYERDVRIAVGIKA